MAKWDRFTVGDEAAFHVTVRASGFDDGCSITIWRGNHGTGCFSVEDESKAIKIAKYLYKQFLPEYNTERKRQQESSARIMAELAARPKPKPVKVSKNAPKIDVLICSECGALVPPDEISDERVYECGECGIKGAGSDARQCDQCHKFCAKVSDTSCPDCEAPMDDAEAGQAQRATNNKLVLAVANP